MKENPALTRIDPVFGFNPKIVFKMLFHAGPKNEAEGVYGKYMVYLGRKEPSTEGEASLLRRKGAYDALLEAGVSGRSVAECKRALGRGCSPDVAIRLSGDALADAASAMRAILSAPGQSERDWTLSILVCDAILQGAGYVPVVVRKGALSLIRKASLLGWGEEAITGVISGLSGLNRLYNVRYPEASAEGIASAVSSCAPALKREFGVRSISLIGSFASGLSNEYSDVDFLVGFAGGAADAKPALKAFLSSRIGRRVDVIAAGDRVSESEDLKRFKIDIDLGGIEPCC